jgi:hypothetical protein
VFRADYTFTANDAKTCGGIAPAIHRNMPEMAGAAEGVSRHDATRRVGHANPGCAGLIAVKLPSRGIRHDRSRRGLRMRDMIDRQASTGSTTSDTIVSARAELQDDHEARAALCAELERVADALPSLPAPARVRRICHQIESTTTHFRRVDMMLEALAPRENASFVSDMLERLAGMHLMDALHGEDLIAILWDSTARGAVARPGEFGYMLRGFFDGCRRVAALESLLLTLFEQSAPQAA